MTTRTATDSTNHYGATQTNARSSQDDEFSARIDYSVPRTQLDDPNLASIYRLRLLGANDWDWPNYDISYCWGELRDGTAVAVEMPHLVLPKRDWRGVLIRWARANGVYLAGLGLFRDGTVSIA